MTNRDNVVHKFRVFADKFDEIYEDVPEGKLKQLEKHIEECFKILLPRREDRRR